MQATTGRFNLMFDTIVVNYFSTLSRCGYGNQFGSSTH